MIRPSKGAFESPPAAFSLLEIVIAIAILVGAVPFLYPIASQWVRLTRQSGDLFLESTVARMVVDRVLDRLAYDPAAFRSLLADSWGSVVAAPVPMVGPKGSPLEPSPYFSHLFDLSGQGAASPSNRLSMAPATGSSGPLQAQLAALALSYAPLAVHVLIEPEAAFRAPLEGGEKLSRRLTVEVWRRKPGPKAGWDETPFTVQTRLLVPVESLEPAEAAASQQRYLQLEQQDSASATAAALESASGHSEQTRRILQQLAIIRSEAARESMAASHLESAARELDGVTGSFARRQLLEVHASQAAGISLAYRRMREALRVLSQDLLPAWEAALGKQQGAWSRLSQEARETQGKYDALVRSLASPTPQTDVAIAAFRQIEAQPLAELFRQYREQLESAQELHAQGRLFEFVFADVTVARDLEQLKAYPTRFQQAVDAAQRQARMLFEAGFKPDVAAPAIGPGPGEQPTPRAASMAVLRWAELEHARRLFAAEERAPRASEDTVAGLRSRLRDGFEALGTFLGGASAGSGPGRPAFLADGGELRAANPAFHEVFHNLRRLERGDTAAANPAEALRAAHVEGGRVSTGLDAAGTLASTLYRAAGGWVLAAVSLLEALGEQRFESELGMDKKDLAARVRQTAGEVSAALQPALDQRLATPRTIQEGLPACRAMRLAMMREQDGPEAACGPVTVPPATEPLSAAEAIARRLAKPKVAVLAAGPTDWRKVLKIKPNTEFPKLPPPGKFDSPPKTGATGR